LLVERARALLRDPGQGEFELGIEPVAAKMPLLAPAGGDTLFGDRVTVTRNRVTAAAQRVISTASRVLYDVLAAVFTSLGFDALGDEVFRDLVYCQGRGADLDRGHRAGAGRSGLQAGEREDDAPCSGPLRQGRLP